MKIISFSIFLCFFMQTFLTTAQIKVYEDNRVKIFGDKPSDDLYGDLSMQVYGPYGEYLANGKIGFGSFDKTGGLGGTPTTLFSEIVYAGELGENLDSDKMELCGSGGLYLTWGQGYEFGNIIGKLDREFVSNFGVLTDISSFQFVTDVYAKGIILNSDERFKENIRPLKNSLLKLQNIEGVYYNFKNKEFDPPDTELNPTSNKEKQDIENLLLTNEKLKVLNHARIGFIAEEIKEIFPDLVKTDSKGFLHVDYVGLIPVLVESIKEQQTQIALLNKLLNSYN